MEEKAAAALLERIWQALTAKVAVEWAILSGVPAAKLAKMTDTFRLIRAQIRRSASVVLNVQSTPGIRYYSMMWLGPAGWLSTTATGR